MARVNGAGAHEPAPRSSGEPETALAPATGGAFSQLALIQYAALAGMRWRAFRNGLRSTRGVLEATAGGINYFFYALTGLGMTAGLGTGAYFLALHGHWRILPVLLWVVFALWQTMPIALVSAQQQFDLSGLLRFPLGFQPFFLLHLLFGLIDSSTILGALGCLGIWAGVSLARPGLSGWAALALGSFAVFNLLLSRAVFVWFDRWLSQRRTREILSALFFAGILSLQFLNPALHRHTRSTPMTHAERAAAQERLAIASAAQSWFPPGLAAQEIERAAEGDPASALESVALLVLYGLATGVLLAVRLRAEHRGESLSDAPAQKKVEKRSNGAARGPSVSIAGSGPIGAIIGKDLRTVMRSMALLYAVFAPLLMVLVLASLMHSGRASRNMNLAMPLCVAYALLGFTQLIYNNLGAEGAGIQLLFLSPTPIRTVFLAKNIFHALIFCAIGLTAGLLAGLRLGVPNPGWLAATAAWLVFALLAHLAVGNIFSLTMPHRINLGRIGRQRGAQATALLGMLAQLVIVGVGAATVAACLFFGRLWLAAPILLVLAVPASVAWMRTLGNAEVMANRRRDELIATLVKSE